MYCMFLLYNTQNRTRTSLSTKLPKNYNFDEILMIERGNILDEKFINIKVDIDKLFFFLQWFYRHANINDMFFRDTWYNHCDIVHT